MAYTLTDIAVPEFHFDLENNTASAVRVVRLVPWSELDQAVEDLAGGSLSFGQLIITTQPVKYPGKAYLWLLDIKAKPFFDCVGDVDVNDLPEDPDGAELTLTYKTPRFESEQQPNLELPDGTYLTIERNQSLEYTSEEAQGLFWPAGQDGGDPFTYGEEFTGNPLPLDAKITSSVAIGDIRMTWHRVKDPPWKAIAALQGMVNDAIFLTYGPEQVMFVGVQDTKQFQVDGTNLYQLTYQFSLRIPKFKQYDPDLIETPDLFANHLPDKVVTGGWNHYPRKGAVGTVGSPYWQKVYRRAGTSESEQEEADLLFIPGDFRKLFQPDPSSSES